jgi:hypothetical protein
MNRINFSIFFVSVFLISVFFPLKGLTVGTYEACPRAYPVYYKIETPTGYGHVCCSVEEIKTAKKNHLESCVPVPDTASAGARDRKIVCYEGLVPCGIGKSIWENGSIASGKCSGGTFNKDGVSCQFCHFFVIMNGLVSFILINIIPYLAIFMLVVGGLFFYIGGSTPSYVQKGKDLIKNVIIGLILIYSSYILVGLALAALGVTNISLASWADNGAFSINCMIQ